ncbi:MAG TPA: SIR2 family protein, partial [Methylomirabilota bacterium]|nr:SIR2 family protein [Methylomirabilota bacterium]
LEIHVVKGGDAQRGTGTGWTSWSADGCRAWGLFIASAPQARYDRRTEAPPAEPMPPELLAAHYRLVTKAIADGRLVPFLGAGVNLCGRPAGESWQRGRYLPSGAELAEYLAETYGYPASETRDLVRVSQYVAVMTGSGPLYEELRGLFQADYLPTALHELLARLPKLLRDKRYPARACHQLIVTTNYDDTLERAFQAAGEAFDLVSYVAEGEWRGRFLHLPPAGEARVIERPNEYRGLSLDERPVILKIHGAIDRANPERDSFVITEDHYIDYLTRTELSSLVPVQLAAHLRKSHFLFLGYGLRDWNLRVILHRIWGAQKLTYKSWAIQFDPTPMDKEFWQKRDVEILAMRLEDYLGGLATQLETLPPPGPPPAE